jgi:hypothetical protein
MLDPGLLAVIGICPLTARSGCPHRVSIVTDRDWGLGAGARYPPFSKVGLLALVWRRTFSLANRVPLLPVLTALTCLSLAAFVFQAAVADPNVFIPARVLVGLGAICFSLYSIVSILESGTSSSG